MRALSWWVVGIWGLAFALLILNAAVSAYNIDVLTANDRAVYHSRDVSRALADLVSALKDAETGQRGYQITGQDEYLAPYRDGEREVPGHLDRLRGLTEDDPFHQPRVAQLIDLVAGRMAELRRNITVRQQLGREAARELIARGEGKALMDQIRALAAEMEHHEEDVLAEKSRVAQARYKSAQFTALVGGVLTVLMVAMAFALVRRELAARRRAEGEARRSADELAASQRETADTLALLDTFLANAPIGMAFFDPDLRYVRINEVLAAANGRPAADHLDRPLLEAIPNMPQTVVSDLREVLETGQALLAREVVGRPGGPDRVWLSNYYPVRAKDGRPLGVGVVAQDVTERVAAERRLRESEARKTAILETALDCVISIDHSGKVVEFNPAAERTFGYPRAEAVGRDMADLIVPPVHRAGHRSGLERFLATGEGPVLNRRIELPALRRDGTEFPAELAITAVSVGGRPVFTAYLRDITARKLAEDALRESLDRFRTLAEAVPQMVWVSAPNGRITQLNRRWVEYTGLTADQVAAGDWADVVHPDDRAEATAAWRAALSRPDDGFTHEFRVRSQDGEYRWVLATAVPVRGADGRVLHWVGTLTDIDDQKRQRDVLAALVKMRTAELESANQLLREEIAERARAEGRAQAAAVELGRSNEELEKFAYVASHDLQEPLRKIQAFGDRLANKFKPVLGADGAEYVDRMQAAAGRMRTLINDLLSFSRVTTKGQPFAPVDLGEIVSGVLSDLELRVSQTGGRVEVGELPTITADPLQMRQLFQNLIGNALKFHKRGEPPVATIRAVAWDHIPAGTEPPAPAGNGWRITVADNGIGFDPGYAERIFEVFQRLHGRGEYEGTGIGLAICRKIVQRHGGEIVARGQDGEGATFVIDLPAEAR